MFVLAQQWVLASEVHHLLVGGVVDVVPPRRPLRRFVLQPVGARGNRTHRRPRGLAFLLVAALQRPHSEASCGFALEALDEQLGRLLPSLPDGMLLRTAVCARNRTADAAHAAGVCLVHLMIGEITLLGSTAACALRG